MMDDDLQPYEDEFSTGVGDDGIKFQVLIPVSEIWDLFKTKQKSQELSKDGSSSKPFNMSE